MDFLRKLKNQASISRQAASFATMCTQLQLLYIVLIAQNIPLYGDLMGLLRFNSSQAIQIIVSLHFILNAATLFYAVMKGIFFTRHKSTFDSVLLKFFKIKPNLLLVFLLNWNIASYSLCPPLQVIISGFNVAFMLLEILVFRIANISYRFQQQDFICRKNNNFNQFLLLIPIVLLLRVQSSLYSAGLIIIRASMQLYYNAFSLQNQVIQFNDFFGPLLLISFSIVEIGSFFIGHDILRSSHLSHFLIIFLFTITSASFLAKSLVRILPKYQLKKSKWFSKKQIEANSALQVTQTSTQINQMEQQSFILSLRILVFVYLAKQKYRKSPNKKQDVEKFQEFDYWWLEYNQLIINHRLYCSKVSCSCQQLKIRSQENYNISQTIFLQILFTSITGILTLKPPNPTQILIIQKYFYIQLLQKPIKSYYELMKLKNTVTKRQQILEVESLILQARDLFQNLFCKQKVQNQNLAIDEVLNFQKNLKGMKKQFIQLSLNYKKFYDVFGSIYVQIHSLKQAADNLQTQKTSFRNQLQTNMHNFSRNLDFLSFSYVYYKYFDEYTENLPKVQKKIIIFQQLRQIQTLMGNKNFGRKTVDVFDPIYGAVKIDLVHRPGQIQSVTKNICELLGFSRQQVQGKKVNKIMPYIFARFHDRFLKHFIQKGSIVGMKKKQRIFFAKSSNKFIFPITVRLKVEYFSSEGFSASSLIKKTLTKSEFILVNNYGKIEEVTEKLYSLLFKKGFQEESSKVKRMNLFKMILSLNHFVKNPNQSDDRIYDGIITTAQDQESFFEYFKYMEYNLKLNKKVQNSAKNEGGQGNSFNSANQGRTDDKTDRSNSSLISGGESIINSGFLDNTQISQPDYDDQKCSNDMKEAIKDYLKKVKLQKIKAFKLAYKFYDLVTPQFKCKVLEVISVKQELSDTSLRIEVPKEMMEVGEIYELSEELNRFKRAEIMLTGIPQSREQLNIAKGCLGLVNYPIGQESKSCTSSTTDKQRFTEPGVQQMASVTSSLNSNTQNNIKKSSVINAFEIKTSINQTLEISLTLLILSVALSLSLICVYSTTLKPDYQTLQRDNIIISKFKNDFQSRLAIQELDHFYNSLGFQTPQFIIKHKEILEDSLKKQLQNSVQWISEEISGYLYKEKMSLSYFDSGFKERRSILGTLGQIYSMFLMEKELHLSDNYVTIRNQLQNLELEEVDAIKKHSYDLITKIHLVVSFYGITLALLVAVLILINNRSMKKECQIMDYLPFIDMKQVLRKIQFYDELTDFLKDKEEILIHQIQSIAESAQLSFNKISNLTSRFPNSKPSTVLSRRLLQIQAKQTQVKAQSNSRFIRILKDSTTTISLKSITLMVLLGCICLVVIIETQYLFISAHQKFKIYIDLKQESMSMQSIPSKLILIYLINMNKVLNHQKALTFPSQFYTQSDEVKYGLRTKLSLPGIHGTQLAETLNQHYSNRLCSLIDCNKSFNDQNTEFKIYRFVNAFHYMQMLSKKLPLSNQTKEETIKWLKEGNVLNIFKDLEQILDLIKKNYEDITNLFTFQINLIVNNLVTICLALIPVLIISFLIVRTSFLKFNYARIYSIENIYRQLSWEILTDNTYAINYFQTKLKNAKKV